jgi:hypothetical protein
MQIITSEEIKEWKTSPVTRAFMNGLLERLEETKVLLTAPDITDQRFRNLQGYYMAIQDTLDTTFEEENT